MLGLWLAENKGAKFLLSVLIEVRQRGVHDIYIASMDGLEGLPEAVNVVLPKTLTQLCIVHLVRASFRYVSRSGARWWGCSQAHLPVCECRGGSGRAGCVRSRVGCQVALRVRGLRTNWYNMIPLFQFLPEIRKVIYTANAIEPSNMVMRKYTRNRRIFPSDESALKALFLAIGEASELEGLPQLEAGAAELPVDVR